MQAILALNWCKPACPMQDFTPKLGGAGGGGGCLLSSVLLLDTSILV